MKVQRGTTFFITCLCLERSERNGKSYVKNAIEQNADGSYRTDQNALWRAYDSWAESVVDHNTYISERKIGNQKEPNWKDVIGCENYILAVQYLQGAQFPYATSKTYEESLINDYIEKYNLMRFDEFEPEQAAPEGYLWIVQAGAYKKISGAKELQERLEKMGVVSTIKKYRQ